MTPKELELPPSDFFETEFKFQTVKAGSRYLRLYSNRYPNPLIKICPNLLTQDEQDFFLLHRDKFHPSRKAMSQSFSLHRH